MIGQIEFADSAKIRPISDEMERVGKEDDDKEEVSKEKVNFFTIFKYASNYDIFLFILGCICSIGAAAVLPCINLVFGEVTDSIAADAGVEELINRAVIMMSLLGVIGFFLFFGAFAFISSAGATIANKWRLAYLEALLQQDATFFDNVSPGELSITLSDAAMEIQSGISDKFAQAFIGVMQLFAGFTVAFYFGWELSLVLLACVPALVIVTVLMSTYGTEDGIYGKEAYMQANEIALETIQNIKTIFALNSEVMQANKYNAKLVTSEEASIRQGVGGSCVVGLLWLVIFSMYGIGFWYGAGLIANSTDDAIRNHPMPANLTTLNDTTWGDHATVIDEVCSEYTGVDLEICACGIPWDNIDYSNPDCGCGYGRDAGDLGVQSICFTGGKTMLVFFSILIGGFGLGQMGPGVKLLGDALLAVAKMQEVILRTPLVNSNAPDGKKLEKVRGEITLKGVHFSYKKTVKIADDEK